MAAALNPMLHDASSSSSYRCSYHAFLSFRGKDTRKGFTNHLYRALELAGIHTFRDDEIEIGADIAAELNKAINESKVSIIVFSQNYASSRWCLDELVKIMERRKHDDGHNVIPVFYNVDPSHVRNQRGSFAEAFSRHEERFKEEMNKVEEWRRALKDAADLAGMALKEYRYESQFIQEIVKKIGNKLDPKVLNVAPYDVGIDDRAQGKNMWLEDGSNGVGVAVIYGMGGIGKTTIAKAAYNRNFERFQVSSFLADIGEAAEQPYGFVRLQRQIDNIDEGIIKIKHAVCNKRLLIVLDDVNDSDQFNTILGMREWFYLGSKIIITTCSPVIL